MKAYKTIDEYIQDFPKNTQTILKQIRSLIKELVPQGEEAIKYGMPTFRLNGKNLVHFAGWQSHIGFYPTPSATEEFKKEITKYKFAKGSIQFPLDKPMPYTLIKKITKFRLAQVKAQARS